MRIVEAQFPRDAETVRGLFRAYADWLQVDLCFQDFEAELAGLPGVYAAPRGVVYLAWSDAGEAVGCVALKPLAAVQGCEMKRLYVAPSARGQALGKRLVTQILAAGRARGYRRMVLDTLSRLEAALAIYRSEGFVEIPAYYDNPEPGVLYLGLEL